MLKLSRRLDPDHRVVRYDRRGYGRSKPHDGPFDMTQQVADLVELLDDRRAIVVGHSYGGNVALATAARHPDVVRAVAVYESPLSWMAWWPGPAKRLVAGASGGVLGDDAAALAAERFMVRSVGMARWDALPERVREERRREGVAFVNELADLSGNVPWSADDIDVPVAVVYGEESAEHHRDGCHLLAEMLSDRAAIAIEGARHNGPFTHPAEVADVVRALDRAAPA